MVTGLGNKVSCSAASRYSYHALKYKHTRWLIHMAAANFNTITFMPLHIYTQAKQTPREKCDEFVEEELKLCELGFALRCLYCIYTYILIGLCEMYAFSWCCRMHNVRVLVCEGVWVTWNSIWTTDRTFYGCRKFWLTSFETFVV